MAEEAKEDGESSNEEAPKKKLDMMLILLGVQVLVVAIAGGLITKVALTPKKIDLRVSTLKERAIASVHDDVKNLRYVEFESFTVGIPGKHTIQTKVQIEVSDEKIASLIQKKMPAVRMRIIDVLSQRSFKELEHIQGKLLMKDAIRDTLNDEISSSEDAIQGVVRDVYFMELMLI